MYLFLFYVLFFQYANPSECNFVSIEFVSFQPGDVLDIEINGIRVSPKNGFIEHDKIGLSKQVIIVFFKNENIVLGKIKNLYTREALIVLLEEKEKFSISVTLNGVQKRSRDIDPKKGSYVRVAMFDEEEFYISQNKKHIPLQ